MSIFLLATLDTKGAEAALIRDRLRDSGLEVTVVDTGCLGEPGIQADVSREEVYLAAGTSHARMLDQRDRGTAVSRAAEGAAKLVGEAWQQGRLGGVIGLGGSAGTTIGATAMRGLPVGVPKLIVSTLASGQVRQYVRDKDILMMNSVVDIAGINRISRAILGNAASAMAGMALHGGDRVEGDDRPLVAASMFGVTTPCVERAREVLERSGYEVLVFHATGNGGEAMESLIREGQIAGVLDVTTTELADELVGGVLTAGPDRLTAAGEARVPQVVSVGATDMVNFTDVVPADFEGRLFYQHNPTVTLMRTTPEECAELGKEIARKVSASAGKSVIMLPLRGVSAIDAAGQPFDDPIARESLFDAIRQGRGNVELLEMDNHINDEVFAEAAARRLMELIEQQR